MSITDELRKYAVNLASLAGASTADVKNALEDIADRIDVAIGDYMPLPKDADGVLIHIGDELEWLDGNRLTVNGIGEGGTLFYVDVQGDIQWTAAGDKRHVQHDSWERIISDATALGAQMKRRTYQIGDFVERCKRLAGEDA